MGNLFALNVLHDHGYFSCSLLFFSDLFRVSAEIQIRQDLPWVITVVGDTAIKLGPASTPSDPPSKPLVSWDGDAHVVQRKTC